MTDIKSPPVSSPITTRRVELPLAAKDCGACQSTMDVWTEALWRDLGFARFERDQAEDERRRFQASEKRFREHLRSMAATAELESVPGLDIACQYEPASQDSAEGGDFRDAYHVGDQRYALVVGEVSGGGPEAAAQAAALRNFLRFALCSDPSLASAVTRVNHICVRHSLLQDFATLFVAIYNARAGSLVYVNARHEPALLRRGSNDSVEMLAATGPCLGAIDTEPFEERAASLNVSDTLAIYTDGLTERAPRYHASLGVARLIEQIRQGDSRAARCAEDVFAVARGGAPEECSQDDASLMVVIRTGVLS